MFGKDKKGISERDIILTYGVDKDGLQTIENPTKEQLKEIQQEFDTRKNNGEKITFRIDPKKK